MQYSIYVNQWAIMESGIKDLDIIDGAIIDFMRTFINSEEMEKQFVNGKTYFWFSYEYISKKMPLLKLKKDSVYRRLKKLCDLEILEVNPNNNKNMRPFYRFTPLMLTLYSSSERSDRNPNGFGQKSDQTTDGNPSGGSDENPTYNINILNNTNTNNTISSLSDDKEDSLKKSVKKSSSKPKAKNSIKPEGGRPKVKMDFTQYPKFIDIYWQWHIKEEGHPPNIRDKAQGEAAKKLINYLMVVTAHRAQADGKELTILDMENEMLKGWQLVLDRWKTLEDWLQKNTKLSQISSNIQNILKQVKNASKKTNGGTPAGVVGAVAERFKR